MTQHTAGILLVLAWAMLTVQPTQGEAADATPSAAPRTAPTRSRPASVVSPEIAKDRRVTFRLKASQANEVSVSGQSIGKTAMVKDTNGIWSATVGPVEPGVWEYSLTVDGVQMVDPGNPSIKPQRSPRTSILHIPGPTPLPWDFRVDVPHGTMHYHLYQAKTLDRQRRLHVYTPPGYESNRQKYPVLYLVHGFSDNDAAWSEHGKAHWILDNLIADGKARPMIVVMPDGHPVSPETQMTPNYGTANMEAFAAEMMRDILPLVEKSYRVKNDSSYRALAGLSMGGGHTLYTGLIHLGKFGYLGAFSAGVPGEDRLNGLLAQPKSIDRSLKLFWIACGKDDFLIERNRKLDALLTEKGIRHQWVQSPGDHSWPIWRRYLTEFAPLLF